MSGPSSPSATPIPPGRDRDLGVVDDLDAVLNHGDPGLLDDLAVLDLGLVERHVIGLPLKRGLAGVDRRRDLLVDRATVVVLELELVGVENLELVIARQIDAAVASALAVSVGHVGNVEFEMELKVAESLVGHDVSVADREDALMRPATWRAFFHPA